MPNNKLKVKSEKSKIETKKSVRSLKSATTAKATRPTGLSVGVYDSKGKLSGKISLPKEIFGAKINEKLMAQAVRVYLANQRQGTVSTKTRGEVRGSSRKIYKQKGTGRARHGSIRAPIFVHGGLVFGPKPNDFSLKLPKKMKKAALFSALSAKTADGEVKVLSGIEKLKPKTKNMALIINSIFKDDKKRKALLVLAEEKTENLWKIARNIEGISVLPASSLNTYEVLVNKDILLMKEAIEDIEKRFLGGSAEQNNK
ncbi:MAG: 50S ribosomal protein L4 [Candidatus Levybacteria bacterium]|nr:50S ribosomal protein L4 [Candidatus Levybacteria bacterium]MBI2420786.1 50S ribosomal protein L4 [Candidatus Levybacteria bacterium]